MGKSQLGVKVVISTDICPINTLTLWISHTWRTRISSGLSIPNNLEIEI